MSGGLPGVNGTMILIVLVCDHASRAVIIIRGLRRIEWVILRLKTPQSWGLQGAFAFLRDLKFGTTDGWHEHRNVHGGFGIRIRFLVFDRNRQCAESLVIRKHA